MKLKFSLGLLGRKISHSRSQEMYEKILNHSIDYHLFDYDKPEFIPTLEEFFEKVSGLSITAPYKEHFLKDVELDEISSEIGAINCIAKKDNKYFGTITDFNAVKEILINYQSRGVKNLIILGDGVMSRLTQIASEELDLTYKVFSRKIDSNEFKALDLSVLYQDGDLVVNSCSREYVYERKLKQNTLFWDYNYSFDKHDHIAQLLGENYQDGASMLYKQALYALKFWNL